MKLFNADNFWVVLSIFIFHPPHLLQFNEKILLKCIIRDFILFLNFKFHRTFSAKHWRCIMIWF